MAQGRACPRAAVGHRSACACAVKTDGRASHPVWGFKNIKAGGGGGGDPSAGRAPGK